MSDVTYKYIIVGGGLAAASAIEGIREKDTSSPIALLGEEKHLPYHRPPLSKKLWFGKMQVKDIFLHDRKFYSDNKVDLILETRACAIDPAQKTVTADSGRVYRFEKLLLATGGKPKTLPIPGGTIEGLHYFRTLADFERIRAKAGKDKTAVVIGGGFIGSEMAAALNINDVKVTMIFPGNSICERVFPATFSLAVQNHFIKNGVTIINDVKPMSFSRHNGKLITETEDGRSLLSDMVIIGAGIAPETKLASTAGLKITNGIAVNERLETSKPDIYAAGDNACFPCPALDKTVRFEHWDNAINQGKRAGRNMAGASEPYRYLPYFYSDLFNFGYEAVGEVDSRLKTITDWQEENKRGVIYYLENNRVRGVLLCDIWEKIPEARKLIEQKTLITEIALPGNLWN